MQLTVYKLYLDKADQKKKKKGSKSFFLNKGQQVMAQELAACFCK
jgi:hypothetical protein